MSSPFGWVFVALLRSFVPAGADFWAVLIAGSRGFANYRHQADICHTHLLMTQTLGIAPSRIVLLMYDDAAWSLENPLIGRLYNEPNGINVYERCNVDYRTSDVSLPSLEYVLTGESKRNFSARKRIHSDHTSTVFISFVDHGECGGLLLPNGDSLTGKDFANILHKMKAKYMQLIFYVEACYAGSVFENMRLPEKVIVVTASNATESSWGTYCPTPKHPSADEINGIHIGACLADLFEISWKNDLEDRFRRGDFNASFGQHLEEVKSFVAKKSNVMVYGDLTMLEKPLVEIFPYASISAGVSPITDSRNKTILLESSMRNKRGVNALFPEIYTLPSLAE